MGAPIRTTCAYCGVGCGVLAQVTGPRSVTIRGDAAHPANHGRLCSKGTHLGETVGLEGRLLTPMIGDGEANWDEALDLVAARMRECIAEHGPDSVAFYVSGQLLTEDYYAANKLMKGFIGSGNIDTNSRLCMASAVAAHNRAFGEDLVPCSYSDLDEADLVLLVGSNTAWCHPVVWQRLEKARATRGTKLVVIDPRRTETAEQADLHVAVAPDGDIALFNALLAEMRRRGLVDDASLAARVETDAGFWTQLDDQPGVPAETFAALCDLVAAHPRMVTLFSQGANQSVCGTDKGNAIINLHLATGRISTPGTGPFSITGQPNAMGGREVGGLANMLACHLSFGADERADVAAFWDAPNLCAGPGLKAVEMFRAIHEGRIRFLWVIATNPAVSMPDSAFVREALARCPTVIVSDILAETDTARFAHVRLPALGWGEKDGTVTNSERQVSRQRALFPPPGEARADWRVISAVAARLGWGEAFAWSGPAAIFREFAAMTKLATRRGRALDLAAYAGLSDAEYDVMEPFQWGGRHPLALGCPTPSGKARLVRVAAPAPRADAQFPLRLNTARYRDQWHTMTRTGLSPTLSQHRREPLLEVHPQDAAALGLEDTGLARVETRQGAAIYRVALSPGQRRGELCVPMHWTDQMAGEGRTNRLASPATDPVSGQPGFKDAAARVQAITPDWRGFLVRRDGPVLDGPMLDEPVLDEPGLEGLLYWTRSRVKAGWLYELAGEGAIAIDTLLPAGDRIEVADEVRGMRRIAVRGAGGKQGMLEAAVYLTRSGLLPAREWVASQLGSGEAATAELLAARPSEPLPDRGAMVCVCHGVGEKDIAAAVLGGACTVEDVGACTRAGTNCGSCRPAIARLVAAMPPVPSIPLVEAAE
jgi:assimilatory nitrate reductase catalytic subunit